MKKIFINICLLVSTLLVVASCDKKDVLQSYDNGNEIVLSSSTLNIAPTVADSGSLAVSLFWTNPNYATANAKFVLEIDTASNFATAVKTTVVNQDTIKYLAKEWNEILLGFGLNFNTQYPIYTRVVSSYENNNDVKISNSLTIQSTPYKVPPKIALPASLKLFIVGDAPTAPGYFSWSNPVPTPHFELSRLSETRWGGVFQFTGGGQFLILPVNGDWNSKYSVASNSVAGIENGGSFGFNLNDNFKGPQTAGWYKVELEFQTGMFAITPYDGQTPENLWITGDATPGGWVNNPPANQKFTRLNAVEYVINSLAITGGSTNFKFVPVSGSWDNLYGGGVASADKLNGTFQYQAGGNLPSPATAGNYKIELNMIGRTYKFTKL